MSDNDNGAYELAREAMSEAQSAQSEAERALSEAQDAASEARAARELAERADEKAEQALREINALEVRIASLENAVEQLINMLQAEIRNLIEETRQVERAVQAQGREIQDRVMETTKSVEDGFSSMGQQEAENRLLDTRTALAGLVVRLAEAQKALVGEYEMARRRGESQKARFTGLIGETVRSLNTDIERLGAQILQIQGRDFTPLVQRTERLDSGVPEAFDVARQVGEVSLEQRKAALDKHVKRLDVDLSRFSAERRDLLAGLQKFSHDVTVPTGQGQRIALPLGDYAMRVYVAETSKGPEHLVGATVEVGQSQVVFSPVQDGLGRLSETVGRAVDTAAAGSERSLTADERTRLGQYLDHFHSAGLLTPDELGIIRHHVEQGAIIISTPISE